MNFKKKNSFEWFSLLNSCYAPGIRLWWAIAISLAGDFRSSQLENSSCLLCLPAVIAWWRSLIARRVMLYNKYSCLSRIHDLNTKKCARVQHKYEISIIVKVTHNTNKKCNFWINESLIQSHKTISQYLRSQFRIFFSYCTNWQSVYRFPELINLKAWFVKCTL